MKKLPSISTLQFVALTAIGDGIVSQREVYDALRPYSKKSTTFFDKLLLPLELAGYLQKNQRTGRVAHPGWHYRLTEEGKEVYTEFREFVLNSPSFDLHSVNSVV